MPDRESLPLPEIVTAARYQPKAFAGLPGTAVACGACVSSLTVNAAFELLPAASVQLSFTAAPAVSGLLYVLSGSHPAGPDVASDQCQLTSTPDFHHPLAFGAGLGDGVAFGGVES